MGPRCASGTRVDTFYLDKGSQGDLSIWGCHVLGKSGRHPILLHPALYYSLLPLHPSCAVSCTAQVGIEPKDGDPYLLCALGFVLVGPQFYSWHGLEAACSRADQDLDREEVAFNSPHWVLPEV